MTLLLHAITQGRVPDPPAGLRGGALEFISIGALGVWASTAPDPAQRDDVFDHHRVVEQLCDRRPCLPIRYGTRAEGAQGARELLGPREADLAAALARVGARRELAVTLLWSDSGARPGRGHDLAPGVTSGRAFLERRRLDHQAADERRRRAEELARALESGLASDQADVRHAYCPSPEIALSTSVLAPAGEEQALKEAALRVAGGLLGVRAVVSGPWPPYTFAT